MAIYEDPAFRLEELLDDWEPRLKREFLQRVKEMRSDESMEQIALLLAAGRIEEAIQLLSDGIAVPLSAQVSAAYVASGTNTAGKISELLASARRTALVAPRAPALTPSAGLSVTVSFDSTNQRAVNYMRRSRLRLVQDFTNQQRLATQSALREGVARGAGPQEMARLFRDSIGLTEYQQNAVNNYRRLLESRSAQALQRELRDRRFDPTVRSSIRSQTPLTEAQIDRMVERYRQRYLIYRSEVIARSESLRAVHAGAEEMYLQAFDSGELDPADVISKWNTRIDGRERPSHHTMNNQVRPVGEPFETGAGVLIRYPGDPSAPAIETVQCRCVISRRLDLTRVFG